MQKTGFIHGDLHIENILINNTKNEVELFYKIDNFNYNITTKTEYIIMDFAYDNSLALQCNAMDKSIVYDIEYMKQPPFARENTIIYSVKKVIQMVGTNLYKKKNRGQVDPINIAFENSIKKIYFDIVAHGTSILGSFYTESRDYNEFISESVNDTMLLVNTFCIAYII